MMFRYLLALAVAFVGFSLCVADEKPKVDEAELLKSLKAADAVFTAEIDKVKPISQTNSVPPSVRGEVTFKDVKPLRGKSEVKAFGYTHREGTTKNLDLDAGGKVIVAVKEKGVLAIVPATEANLAIVKKAEEQKPDEKK